MIVVFLLSAVRIAVILFETRYVATVERVKTTRKIWDGGTGSKDRFSEVQQDLNNALVSFVHLGKLLHCSRNSDGSYRTF